MAVGWPHPVHPPSMPSEHAAAGPAPRTIWLFLFLALLGAGWGATQPLSKIAVSEGYRHYGIIFWQQLIMVLFLGALCLTRGRLPAVTLPRLLVWGVIAAIGTLLPNMANYEAARHLPAGWISVILSLVPLFAFPIALAFGVERFQLRRMAGLVLGLLAMLILLAPDLRAPGNQGAFVLFWVFVSGCAAAAYALEGNVVARWGTAGMGPFQTLFGASVIGLIVSLPLALSTGVFFWPDPTFGAPDRAILLTSVIHALVYSGYVWLVGRAGSVFAAQVSYPVTVCGVLWSMLLLAESYSGAFWVAVALMLTGLALVQPRRSNSPLVQPAASGQDDGRA